MIIKDYFQNDINRTIETVIKADDRENISTEVSEYVITKEIATKIKTFFEAYNNYAGANGVWISGFFGSGKSHLLKILSYVLENKDFNGLKSGDVFAAKIEDDEILKGDIHSATRIPSESILFNIDQQAQITSKADENAILSVFYKVFYDHIGYYGFQPHVAEFEMWLDKQGKYHIFKAKFGDVYQASWEEARMDYFDPLVTEAIAEVLAEINNTDAAKYENILDTLEDGHKQSIENFCQRVLDYIKLKPKGFCLNFFVDEVGQYISDNTKLMLNLQTIAETLATKTNGRSWILVTSQEDMEKVVGDMNKSQQNDFSKIQARFSIKIPLTSANVDEVIEKRLLKKNNLAQQHHINIYQKDHAHFDTLLSFSDVGIQLKGYKNALDFANKIPFVPYQFDLFQQCRRALSTHNAFQGKHASVGERSMLGVFQQVIKKIENQDDSSLVSFDMMFDGIRSELRGEIQSSIVLAERNLNNALAIQVLKTLFLVKYFSNFKTTRRNISVLLINRINIDLKLHEKNIDEALNLLEQQSYVQRNGDIYEFLTDDEKDIEEEIKNTDIDDQAVTDLLKEIFFDEIISDNKLRYLDNKQDYEFTSKIDGIILGREKELEIEIITENFYDYSNESLILAQTMGRAGMKVILPSNPLFIKDIKMYIRTNKYIKQTQSTTNKDTIKRILNEKGTQNAIRKRTLKLMANKDLAASTVMMNGRKLEMSPTTEGKTLVVNAFQDLIKIVYPNLRMLGATFYSEESFKTTLKANQLKVSGIENDTISEAEGEILTAINRRKNQSERTSLNDLKTIFSKKPYGWYQNAIWTMVARLYKRGKIEIRKDANILDDEQVAQALLNSSFYLSTLIETQVEVDAKLVKALKQTHADFFDENNPAHDAKEVANAFRVKLKETLTQVNELLAKKSIFPFLSSLESFKNILDTLSKKEYLFYLSNLKEFSDDLLDAKEDLFDPIKKFINGEQATIYQSIRTMLDSDTSNFEYIEGTELATLRDLLNHPKPYSGNLIREAKTAKDDLSRKVLERINEEKTKAITVIHAKIEDLRLKDEYIALDSAKQNQIIRPLEEEIDKLRKQRFIANIRDAKSRTLEVIFPRQLNEMIRLSTPVVPSDSGVQEPKPHYVRTSAIKVHYAKSELKTAEDVNDYIEALREAYLQQIKETKRITL